MSVSGSSSLSPSIASAFSKPHAFKAAAIAALATAALFPVVSAVFASSSLGELLLLDSWVPVPIAFMTFWSLAFLGFKVLHLRGERSAMASLSSVAEASGIVSQQTAGELLERMVAVDTRSLLFARIRVALMRFRDGGSPAEVSGLLNARAESDLAAFERSHSLLRTVIWAIPLCGFLGTVAGIGEAVSGFSDAVSLASDLGAMKQTVGNVTTGLGAAFGTTLLALVASMVVSFPAALVQRAEEELLDDVTDLCQSRLVSRLEEEAVESDSEGLIRAAIVEEMATHHAALAAWAEKLEAQSTELSEHVQSTWLALSGEMSAWSDSVMKTLRRQVEEQGIANAEAVASLHVAMREQLEAAAVSVMDTVDALEERSGERIARSVEAATAMVERVQTTLADSAAIHGEQLEAAARTSGAIRETFVVLDERIGEVGRQLAAAVEQLETSTSVATEQFGEARARSEAAVRGAADSMDRNVAQLTDAAVETSGRVDEMTRALEAVDARTRELIERLREANPAAVLEGTSSTGHEATPMFARVARLLRVGGA